MKDDAHPAARWTELAESYGRNATQALIEARRARKEIEDKLRALGVTGDDFDTISGYLGTLEDENISYGRRDARATDAREAAERAHHRRETQ